jgi:hypothetical protein
MLELPCLDRSQSLEGEFQNVLTDVGPIWRRCIVFVVLSNLVEVIFVELPDETGKIAVLEMFGKNQFRELLVL